MVCPVLFTNVIVPGGSLDDATVDEATADDAAFDDFAVYFVMTYEL